MNFVRIELFYRRDSGKLKRFRWQEEGGWGSAFLRWLCGFLLNFSFSALVIWISNSQSNSLGEDSSQPLKVWLLFQLFPLFVNECAPYFDFLKKESTSFSVCRYALASEKNMATTLQVRLTSAGAILTSRTLGERDPNHQTASTNHNFCTQDRSRRSRIRARVRLVTSRVGIATRGNQLSMGTHVSRRSLSRQFSSKILYNDQTALSYH